VHLRQEELTTTTQDRDALTAQRDTVNTDIGVIRQCVGGARAALDALQRHDQTGTINALRIVDGPCRAALAAEGGLAPRYGFEFPDPYVLTVGDQQWAFATNSTAGNIQVLHHAGADAWATTGDALGQFPAWAAWGRTWAPDAAAGPGGASVFTDAHGRVRLAYHAYVRPNVGYPASRLFFVAGIDLSSGHPVVVG